MHVRKILTVTVNGYDRYGNHVEAHGTDTRDAVATFMAGCRESEAAYEVLERLGMVSQTLREQPADQVAVRVDLEERMTRRERVVVPPMPRGHYPAQVEPTLDVIL